MIRGRARSDTITLVPACELPFRDEWQAIANGLPLGAVLFVVPDHETTSKRTMRQVAAGFRAQGRPVYARRSRCTGGNMALNRHPHSI